MAPPPRLDDDAERAPRALEADKADEADRAEMLEVASPMETLRAPG